MPLLYPIKRVFRSWKLFMALLIGVILASTFFAAIYAKANLTAKQALEQQLNNGENFKAGKLTDNKYTEQRT